MAIATINPATGETVCTFEALNDDGIDAALQRTVSAFHVNRSRSLDARASRMRKAADLLDSRARDLGRLITIEMGKPITAAIAEIRKCALVCRYYAEHAAVYLSDEAVKTDAQESYIRYEPI